MVPSSRTEDHPMIPPRPTWAQETIHARIVGALLAYGLKNEHLAEALLDIAEAGIVAAVAERAEQVALDAAETFGKAIAEAAIKAETELDDLRAQLAARLCSKCGGPVDGA